MYIRNIDDFIPNNGFYNSSQWYIEVNEKIEKVLKALFGDRELFDDGRKEDVESSVKNRIDVLFMANDFNYEKMFEALTADYNPLYNVDGTETLTYVKDNTGTQRNVVDNTGTQATSGTNTGTQATNGTNTGTQGTSGSDTGTQTTADASTKTLTTSKTTYDSATEYETQKDYTANGGQITRTDNLAHSETRTDNLSHAETRTDNLSHSETRTDNLKEDGTRTDNLKEEYTEIKKRAGNIGVTRSDELIEGTMRLRLKYNFINLVCKDIATFISYDC